MTPSLLVKGGQVVLPHGVAACDLRVVQGRISEIAPTLQALPHETVEDVSGCYVLPGLVDMHTHFGLAADGFISEAIAPGTRAASRGGITTVVDFAGPGKGSIVDAVGGRLSEFQEDSITDYALHTVIVDWEQAREHMLDLVQHGHATFKVFTVYRERGLALDEPALRQIIEFSSNHPVRILVHAEDQEIIDEETRRLVSSGHLGFSCFARSRPVQAEILAVEKVCRWAQELGGRVHIVHVSSAGGAMAVARARTMGAGVSGETGPQYLAFTAAQYERADGHLWSCCPPFRETADQDALWSALASGDLAAVATDTCGFPAGAKAALREDFRNGPFGVSSAEHLLPFMVTFGVKTGRLSWPVLVARLCEQPARLSGLFPRKGTIRPGSDADLVILDPASGDRVVEAHHCVSTLGHCPFEGMALAGVPLHVMRRGEWLVREGRPQKTLTAGLFIPQGLDNLIRCDLDSPPHRKLAG